MVSVPVRGLEVTRRFKVEGYTSNTNLVSVPVRGLEVTRLANRIDVLFEIGGRSFRPRKGIRGNKTSNWTKAKVSIQNQVSVPVRGLEVTRLSNNGTSYFTSVTEFPSP